MARNETCTDVALPALGAANWPQIDRSSRQLLLLPLGSTEQHGPHLPLDTDTVVAMRAAQEIHARYPSVGLAPAIPYGASGEHAAFPGTLSIGTDALCSVIVEFVRHAASTWRHVLVVNGHGGNADALAHASALTRFEGRSLTVCHAASGGPRADPHAGFRETSLMLYLAPHSVKTGLIEHGNDVALSELLPLIQKQGVRAVSENGILGDPVGANCEHGRGIFETICNGIIAVAERLLRS